ncbi:hypothetical protein ABZ920_15840 [Streptomyces sp. NPDC046831]|uniref:hypothetical protein n=1 Tax=Streptomyces sp. NPDC046831 TaxID=3154805 RepID=UPI0033DEADD5
MTGAILTVAGAALYTMRPERPEPYGAPARVLAVVAAWWCASRQDWSQPDTDVIRRRGGGQTAARLVDTV